MEICLKHNIAKDVESDCPTCHGDGEIEDDEGGVIAFVKCWRCNGSGVSSWLDCSLCLDDERDDV